MGEERLFHTIVVGYDGTREAERALLRSSELARAFGSRIVIADVAAPEPLLGMPGAFGLVPYYPYETTSGRQPDEALWREHRRRVEQLLAERQLTFEFAGRVGPPVETIIEVAEQVAAELIVVGTREPGFLERLFEGSVSAGVARHAGCDVLVVHARAGGEEGATR